MFDDFWKLYPRRVAKRDAEKAWGRMSEKERSEAILALPNHVSMWGDKEKEFIPYPATWLNGRRWEDEIEVKKTFEEIAKERWLARK